MYSIKQSFANCSTCPLLDCNSCILETNCEDDLSKVDLVIVAENPGKDEVAKGVPLIGRAGQTFRKYFYKHNLDRLNYLITNTVLCATLNPDGTTSNPTDNIIDICKENCFNIINICKPKLILSMGASPMKAFNIKGSITKLRGEVFKWNNYNVLLTVHPQYVNYNTNTYSEKFESDIAKVNEILGVSEKIFEFTNKEKPIQSGICRYKIPDKFYTNEYRLLDIQYLNKTEEILYIFRDKDNKKVFHKMNDDYYYYKPKKDVEYRKIIPFSLVDCYKTKYKLKSGLDAEDTYEGDIKLTVKHSQDYYHYNKEDCPDTNSNIMFLDIEVYTGKYKGFPTPTKAAFPISMITCIYNDKTTVFVLSNKKEKVRDKDGVKILEYKDEKELMKKFIEYFRECDPDYVTGWNCIEENEYIYLKNQMKKIKNVQKDQNTFDNGVIRNKWISYKKGYNIKLRNGINITSSKDHIFPIFIKEKDKYYTIDKLLKTKEELTISEIIEKNKEKDIYFKIKRHKNLNKDYTWRQYLLENIDRILNFKEIDIIIKKDFKHELKEKFKNNHIKNIWASKRLKKFITKDDIICHLKKYNEQEFRLGNNVYIKVNLEDKIEKDDLQLLGFLYTDGFWSKYSNGMCFDNKDKESVIYYNNIMNKYRPKRKLDDVEKKWNRRDKLYTLGFGFTNKFTLLMPLIYNLNRKKKLNLETISRLSYSQFCSLFSGMIDGDGSCHDTELCICNFEDNGKDIYKIQKLLDWNYVFSYLRQNEVMVPKMNFNKELFINLDIKNSKRKQYVNLENMFEFKNSCSNIINKFITDDFILIKLDNIKEKDFYNMVDIETEKHYFICNGVETHNCIAFDFEYIYNRCKKIGVNYNKLSKIGEVYVDGSKYLCNIPGVVPLDMEYLYKSFSLEKREMYKLGFIAKAEKLKISKLELEGVGAEAISKTYENDINKLVDYNIRDVEVLIALDNKLKHITLLNEIRKICCSSFEGSSSPMGRLDSLIVNFLKEKGFASKNADPHKQDSQFEGAYVKDPNRGVHDWIVDFDFTSLYPSIIQTYNLGLNSFVFKFKDYRMGYDFIYNQDNLPDRITIIEDPTYSNKEVEINKEELINRSIDEDLIWTITGCFLKKHNVELSHYAEVLQDLLSSRKIYKKKMFESGEKGNDFEKAMFDNKQQVYKILANALYGILGNSAFRFFNIDLARSITLSGQEAIKFSILNGNAYVDKIINSEYKSPEMLTKKEMYEDMSRKTDHVITGDTDSLFITYENLIFVEDENTIDRINKYNIEIQKFLNDFIKKMVIERHNVPSERNKLELKNELVIKRGHYLQKKRYANYILFKEGHEENKIKAMGLETKRSDFPNYTKKTLDKLLELILKTDKLSISKLQEFAEKSEYDILEKIRNGSKVVARPVNWVKEIKNYKTIPQGVKAMESWNKLMYNSFGPGTKGYMFKVRGIDEITAPEEFMIKYNKEFLNKGKKITEIAFPDEEPRLPEWILPDIRAMIKFCWQDRYKLIMEPLIEVDEIDGIMLV